MRSRSRTRRSGSAGAARSGGAAGCARAGSAPDPPQRPLGRQQHHADHEQQHEHHQARRPRRRRGRARRPRAGSRGSRAPAAPARPRTSAGSRRSGPTRRPAPAGPPATSIRYWSAAPIAPPPGATLASALPASCDAITGCQRALRSDSSWSAHRQNSAAPWSAAIASNEPSRQPLDLPPRAERRDHARRHEVERDAADHEPEDRPPQRRAALRRLRLELRSPRASSPAHVGTVLDRLLEAIADAPARRVSRRRGAHRERAARRPDRERDQRGVDQDHARGRVVPGDEHQPAQQHDAPLDGGPVPGEPGRPRVGGHAARRAASTVRRSRRPPRAG